MRYGYALVLCLTACISYDIGEERHWEIEVSPRPGATNVARGIKLQVRLGRRLAADSITSESVRLRSGQVTVEVNVHYNPVTMDLWISPRAPLDADVAYSLEVQGLVDLDGTRQVTQVRASFSTGRELQGAEVELPGLPPAAEDAAKLIRQRCAVVECHASGAAKHGLDLGTASGLRSTALGIVRGAHRDRSARTIKWEGLVRLSELPIVDVSSGANRAARSYLLYKVLGDSHIAGQRMPPPPLAGLTQKELETVQGWIEQGASLQYFQ